MCNISMYAVAVCALQAGNLLKPDMLLSMAPNPVVFACANPVPEIDPETGGGLPSCVLLLLRQQQGQHWQHVLAS